jgi:hypothetical protein
VGGDRWRWGLWRLWDFAFGAYNLSLIPSVFKCKNTKFKFEGESWEGDRDLERGGDMRRGR